MKKHDYGHVGCPYYEEKLENGVNILFVPRKSPLNSALVYIAKGSFEKDSSYPVGTGDFLSHMVLSPALEKELAKDGVVSSLTLDYSYVLYQLTSQKDIFAALRKLLLRIADSLYTEKDVQSFRQLTLKERARQEQNPLRVSQKGTLRNLYLTSPIQENVVPDVSQSEKIHASTLKKYQQAYYVPERITLFLAFDGEEKTVMEKVKALPFPQGKSPLDHREGEKEVYTAVRQEYSEEILSTSHSVLTYGIKMPLRQNIVDKYGQLSFASYEIMNRCMFGGNPEFLAGLYAIRSHFVDYVFKEGGEDSYLLLSFETEDPEALTQYLNQYFARFSHHVTSARFNRTLEEYYIRSLSTLSLPSSLLASFARVYPNHLIYPDFVHYVSRLNYNTYVRFLEEFPSFKKSICYVKKGK